MSQHAPIPPFDIDYDLLVTRAELDVAAERRRQVKEEGWTPEHDDKHNDPARLANAAACYATGAAPAFGTDHYWPWDWKWWKPTTQRRNLVKAAALIIAAIEQIDRKESE